LAVAAVLGVLVHVVEYFLRDPGCVIAFPEAAKFRRIVGGAAHPHQVVRAAYAGTCHKQITGIDANGVPDLVIPLGILIFDGFISKPVHETPILIDLFPQDFHASAMNDQEYTIAIGLSFTRPSTATPPRAPGPPPPFTLSPPWERAG
jgi:hypothetical protein